MTDIEIFYFSIQAETTFNTLFMKLEKIPPTPKTSVGARVGNEISYPLPFLQNMVCNYYAYLDALSLYA